MKIVKITQRMLDNPANLLRKLGAVHEKRAFPGHVYLSKNDYKTLSRNLMQAFKKEFPYLPTQKLKASVAMELFNLGPNQTLEDAIKDGFALVDEDAILKEKALLGDEYV